MKKLILVSNQQKREKYLDKLVDNLKEKDDLYFGGSLEELNFFIDNSKTCIYDAVNKFDLSEYGVIIFRQVGGFKNEAVAVTLYCDKHGIKYIDTMVKKLVGIDDENKLCEMMKLQTVEISVPSTAYGNVKFLSKTAREMGFPCVLKSASGHKGQANYLVKSNNDIERIISGNADKRFVLQAFIPNDGDWRVLVLSEDSTIVTFRRRQNAKTHLNNVSAGGSELFVKNRDVPANVLTIAKQSAAVLGIQVAGVDVVVDENTEKPYIMEVNRAPEMTLPQEVTGYKAFLKRF